MSSGAGGVALPESQTAPYSARPNLRLKVEQASYAYAAADRSAPKFTLGPVSFEAQQRELVAILGPNASGKSTLLKLLAGLLKPLSGRIEVDGSEVSELDLRVRAQKIALVAHGEIFAASAHDGGEAIRVTHTPGPEMQTAIAKLGEVVAAEDELPRPRSLRRADVVAKVRRGQRRNDREVQLRHGVHPAATREGRASEAGIAHRPWR